VATRVLLFFRIEFDPSGKTVILCHHRQTRTLAPAARSRDARPRQVEQTISTIQASALRPAREPARAFAAYLMRSLRHRRHHELPCHRGAQAIAFYLRLSPRQPRATLKTPR
jgi:hypothetical protein